MTKISPALLLALTLPCRAADTPAARLTAAIGKVTIDSKAAQQGDKVADGAAVETAKSATAVVTLPDGGQLKLTELSRATVNLPGAKSLTEIALSFGGVFARVAKQGPGAEFRVRAANAVAAVRGTEFFTAYGRKHKSGRDLWVCVNEGAVELSTDKSDKKLSVPAGKGVLIKSGVDFTEPQAYEWTKKLNWNPDPARGKIEDKTNLDKAYSDVLDQDYR